MCSKFTDKVFVLDLYVTCSSYYQILEQREENVKQTEGLVSSERERVEALEKALILKEEALPQQQKDLVFSSSWILHIWAYMHKLNSIWESMVMNLPKNIR